MSAQVRPGYKLTEVGVIPDDWDTSRLSDLAELTSSKRIFEHDYVPAGIPFYRGKEISLLISRKAIEDPYFISEEKFNEIKQQFGAPKAGDILITAVGTLGNIFVVNSSAKFYFKDGNLIWLRGINSSDSNYVGAQLNNYKSKILDGAIGSSQKALTIVVLRELQIPVAPLPEQRAIAAALSDMDALISGLDQLIAKKRDIKQATMQQLLTGQQRLSGFSGKWEMKRLGEVGFFLKGSGVTRDQSLSGDLPCIRYGEIYTVHNDYIREFKSYISVAVAEAATLIKCGDILFAGSGETKEDIGKCVSFVDDMEAYAGGDIVIFRPKNVDSLFLGYALNTPVVSRQKASRGQGDAVVHISANALASVDVLMPNQAEQSAIATILADMDSELISLETRRNKTRELKQGMMQELLTGRIRLSQSSQEAKLC